MANKPCPQCHEQVEEAKAFCPACGHAFVNEEKRTTTSEYEKMDSTVQMGQTMYNNMLSDMGLNVGREAGGAQPPERRVEALKPVAVQPAQVLQPVAGSPVTPAAEARAEKIQEKSSGRIWLVTIIVAAALLLLFVVAVVLVGLYLYFRAGTL